MTFSMRESQILDQLQLGQTNKQIGATLGISPNTVRDHIRRMMLRTGVYTRVSLATLWLRQAAAPIPLQAAPPPPRGAQRRPQSRVNNRSTPYKCSHTYVAIHL